MAEVICAITDISETTLINTTNTFTESVNNIIYSQFCSKGFLILTHFDVVRKRVDQWKAFNNRICFEWSSKSIFKNHSCLLKLMVEKSDSCEAHCDSILIACIDYIIIPYRTTRLCNIFNTAFMCSFYIITKWEESI